MRFSFSANSSELRSSVLRFPEFPRIPSATLPEYFTTSVERDNIIETNAKV
jgi:hypothetical protein